MKLISPSPEIYGLSTCGNYWMISVDSAKGENFCSFSAKETIKKKFRQKKKKNKKILQTTYSNSRL